MTDAFWESFVWFVYGMSAAMFPILAIVGWGLHREAKKPRLGPVDPEEVRRISAQLASLSRAIARLADPEEPAAKQQEEVRSSA